MADWGLSHYSPLYIFEGGGQNGKDPNIDLNYMVEDPR